MADHAGWLVTIDPKTFKVVARQRLDFGAHGVVVTDPAVYMADAHGELVGWEGQRLVQAMDQEDCGA